MSENPLQLVLKTYEKVSKCIQTQVAQFVHVPKLSLSQNDHHSNNPPSKHSEFPKQEKNVGPLTKEELGSATWTFLHTLGAQYPDNPTRQQKKDVKELMAILSRMYPCQECADHFKEVLRANPVQAGSQAEFSQWLCHVHNVVNRSLSKPIFPCDRVDARWGKLECEHRACDLQGSDKFWI